MTQPEVQRIAFADSFQVMANDDLSPGCRGNLGRIVRAIIGHNEQPIVFPHLRNNIVQRRSDPGALVMSWHQDDHRLANGVVCEIDGFFPDRQERGASHLNNENQRDNGGCNRWD